MKCVIIVAGFGALPLAFGFVAFVFRRVPSIDDLTWPEQGPLWAAQATSWDPEPGSLLYERTRDIGSVDRLVLRVRPMDPNSGQYLSKRSETITGPAVGEIVGVWRQLRAGPALGCITPGYAIDFYAGRRLVGHVELSYGCSNAIFDNGRRVEGFDAYGATGVALRQSLDRALGLRKAARPTRTGPN